MDELDCCCLKCGGTLTIEFRCIESRGMRTVSPDEGRCQYCGEVYPEPALDEIRTRLRDGNVLFVHMLNAARMLGRPGEATWAFEQLRSAAILRDNVHYVPLSAVVGYARRNSIRLQPLGKNSQAHWMGKD